MDNAADLRTKITPENLALLDEIEFNEPYTLEKMVDWQEEYDYIQWDKFKNWTKCDRCKGYDDQQCICYAR